jgi:hypothetical protein
MRIDQARHQHPTLRIDHAVRIRQGCVSARVNYLAVFNGNAAVKLAIMANHPRVTNN